ncbi:MAG: beta-1,6-N-acetylglucosaminyltransferase [Paracoccaceae bacterium]
MTVGFVMLCHTAFDRVAQVARHWVSQGCPVVIHVDTRASLADFERLKADLADLYDVRLSRRHNCEWGTWSIVRATQLACETMLADFPQVRYVYLASGSCLPLRPAGELVAYLDSFKGKDFIESVTTEDVDWTVGGLDLERFTLRFPFSWRKQRRLFDRYVDLQRRLRIRRKIPEGIVPHLGSQWWCLTRKTLSAILTDPERSKLDAYFSRVWIPDESYFQTLARKHSTRIESRSLTLSKFDYQGKPYIFYDDHLQLLRRSDCFIARKIWARADLLYGAFLEAPAPAEAGTRVAEPNPSVVDRIFSKAVERRTRGRPGLYMQSRYPLQDMENGKTSYPYSVFQGFAEVFENFEDWLTRVAGGRVHGHLFAPDRVEFAGRETSFAGALSDSATLRDYNPRDFLTSLIWNTRGERQCFQFAPTCNQALNQFMATDPNAQISIISGAWALPLFRSNQRFSDIRREAARLQKIEREQLSVLRSLSTKARVRVWTMADFVASPMEPLQTIIDEISPRSLRRLSEVPRIVDLSDFGQFLQNLRNQGMQPVLMGDFPVAVAARAGAESQRGDRSGKPYLVQ